LDTPSLLKAALVSRSWRSRVDGAKRVWKNKARHLGATEPDSKDVNNASVRLIILKYLFYN